MIRQSRTTIKELSAQYRSVLKKAFLAGVIALTTMSANAEVSNEDMTAITNSITASLNDSVTTVAPVASDYTYTLPDGSGADMSADTTAATYDNYFASSAADGTTVKIILHSGDDANKIKLGDAIAAASYQYLSKNANGEDIWIAGNVAVADLSKTYVSTYGNVNVSTDAGATETVDIANYTNGDYSLHVNDTTGEIELYQNGALELDSPEMFTMLKNAYDTDVAAVAALQSQLDGYKAQNVVNHDAITGIMSQDTEALTTINGYKTEWSTQKGLFDTAVTNHNDDVTAYNNSLSKLVNDKIVAASTTLDDVHASATVAEVTEPAPEAADYTFTKADGSQGTLADGVVAADFVADSAADGTLVQLASGETQVKWNDGTLTAASYEYSSKNADGVASMVAGNTDVADLNKTYESTYGNINVSTDVEPVVNIANYTSGDYSLHINGETGEIELYQNGALELDSPTMLATLKGAYEADVAGVAALKAQLDEYRAYNVANHDAVTTVMDADNATIAGIAANKATWEDATTNFTADTTAYNNAVTAYDNSVAKVINTKVSDAVSMGAVDGANYAANTTVVDAVKSIDTNMGTIHGLVADANATTTSNGRAYKGNLAVGTTVEDHLLALDSAIGDRRTLDGDHVDGTKSVAENLQSLNDGIEAEATARQNADAALQTAINNINTASVAAVDALDNRVTANTNAIAGLDKKVDDMNKDLSAGIAGVAALSSVEVSNVKKGEMSVGGGYGYFNGESAVAVGAAMGLTDNWSVNAGAGISGNQTAFRAGTNYKFKLF